MEDRKMDLDNERTVRLASGRRRKKKRLLIAISFFLVALNGFGVYIFMMPIGYDESGNLKKAAKAMENNEYDYSIAILTRELKIHRDDSNLYLKRSTLYLKRAAAGSKESEVGKIYTEVDRENDLRAAALDLERANDLNASGIKVWSAKQRLHLYRWYLKKKESSRPQEISEKEDIRSLPEKEQLDKLLLHLYCGSKNKNGNLNQLFDSADLNEDAIYESIVANNMQLASLYPFIKYEQISPDAAEIKNLNGYAESYVKISKEDAAWIASNIFNMTESYQRDFRKDNEKEKTIYTDDKNIYSGCNPIDTSKWSVKYDSVTSDGEKYYIRYYVENKEETGAHGYYFLTASLKEIDGKKYWSIYSNQDRESPEANFSEAKKLKKPKQKEDGLPRSMELIFTSGAGGWWTSLSLDSSGGFTGEYNVHNASEDIRQSFEGRFTNIKQVNEFEYSMQLSEISRKDIHGLSGGKEFRLYLPGRRTADFSGELKSWLWYAPNTGTESVRIKPKLGCVVLCNCSKQYGFYEEE